MAERVRHPRNAPDPVAAPHHQRRALIGREAQALPHAVLGPRLRLPEPPAQRQAVLPELAGGEASAQGDFAASVRRNEAQVRLF